MELSLWPSGRCTLLWVAFPSQLPQGATRGGVGDGQRGWGAVAVVMVGRWGWAPLLPLHGHVKVAFYRETPEGARRGGWHRSGDKQRLRKRWRYESTAPERAGRDGEHHLCFQSINTGIRPSERS